MYLTTKDLEIINYALELLEFKQSYIINKERKSPNVSITTFADHCLFECDIEIVEAKIKEELEKQGIVINE